MTESRGLCSANRIVPVYREKKAGIERRKSFSYIFAHIHTKANNCFHQVFAENHQRTQQNPSGTKKKINAMPTQKKEEKSITLFTYDATVQLTHPTAVPKVSLSHLQPALSPESTGMVTMTLIEHR